LLVFCAFFLDEPLRRLTERQMNERLKSYTATVGRLDFHPIGFAIDLRDVVLVQNANPDPPVMRVERVSANVQWTALIRGRLVATLVLVRPLLHIDRNHLEAEKKDDVPVKDHGWQDALQAIYPLKINTFEIHDGEVTYVEAGQSNPLRMSRITVAAQDILNVRSDVGDYPSPVRVEAVVFDRGRALIEGHADFLAEPHVGVKGNVELADIALENFRPVFERANVVVTRGTFNGKGLVEYSPQFKKVDLDEIRLDGLHVEYVYHKPKAAVAKEAVKTTVQAAKELSNDPGVVVHARTMMVTDATVGFLNKDTSPNYRVFMSNTNLTIENFSNQKSEGYGQARLRGRFMGSGQAAVDLALRAENKGPDFDLYAKIENVDVRRMNDLVRAHARIDVASGVFAVFSEISVKNARVKGYVKPLFKDLHIYDKKQDEDKSLGEKLKEKAADVVAKVFKNRPRDEVATIASVEGPLEDPKASTWELLMNLVRNAFFQAILPGFEQPDRSGRG
jgi:phage host-nuclease inhibitor protein Gam